MDALAWTLIILGDVAIAACAVHLTRRHRRAPAGPVHSVPRTVPILLAAGVFPVPALLAADAPAAAWGLWGASAIAATLVYAVGEALCDLPPCTRTGPGSGAGGQT
ncbi:hypothetical protein ADL29_04065 [Streptomyces chattanoogensis]|uniref:Uncharacterized protein n=1 Tax=Streptomyces chattanoogensis TaxID=66876 RepID=A0A0N0XZT4_9ACTN|nr:hypothetical protein ADL29_04065 [Streptomyces chattanoogensis]